MATGIASIGAASTTSTGSTRSPEDNRTRELRAR
jgi:hypothetical protein